MVPNTNIFYVPREEVDLETFIQQPLPKAPQPLTLTSHWLAIEGIQPMIPENPNLQEPALVEKETGGPTGRKELLEDAEVRPLVKHVISKELQTYYDTVISDLMAPDTDRIKAALYSVATDSGLQQLLPYFIQFVAEMIPKNLRSLPQLQIYIGLVSSLLANEHVFVEPYVRNVLRDIYACSCIKLCLQF
jgi:transcription initiation factor TFIID subunit 6